MKRLEDLSDMFVEAGEIEVIEDVKDTKDIENIEDIKDNTETDLTESEVDESDGSGNIKDIVEEDPTEDPDDVKEVEPDTDEVPEDFLQMLEDYNLSPNKEGKIKREDLANHFATFGEKAVEKYIENRPSEFKDFFKYQLALENPTKEDLAKFYQEYLLPEKEFDVSTNEGAREYLKTRPEFKSIYEGDELESALDILEDKDALVDRAKKLYEKDSESKAAQRQQAIEKAESEKAQRIENTRMFESKVKEELSSFNWSETQKQAAIRAASPDYISNVWSQIVKDPKGFIQFVNLLTYFKEGNFDPLYAKLEGRKQSKEVEEKEKKVDKDSLSKLLGKAKQEDTSDWSKFFQ